MDAVFVYRQPMPKKPARILPYRKQAGGGLASLRLLNLGPKTSAWLAEAGLDSLEKVRRLGPIEVSRRIRLRGHPVSVLFAYALEGALAGCHWNAIPRETKQTLRTAFAAMKAGRTPRP